MANIKTSTQSHLDIAQIKGDIVVLKNGGAAAIVQTNAINFDLLSVQEQDSAIAAFSSLLNSLSFPIQITIRSKKMDITDYLEKVKTIEEKQMNAKIKKQIQMYRSFIKDELVTKENVLEKHFYVTVPFRTFDMSAITSTSWIENLAEYFGASKPTTTKINTDQVLEEAKIDLIPKVTFLIKEFARIGIKADLLKTSELIKLFYEIYNSETAQVQRIRGDFENYTSTLVEPKII
jgi:hypothetical protein